MKGPTSTARFLLFLFVVVSVAVAFHWRFLVELRGRTSKVKDARWSKEAEYTTLVAEKPEKDFIYLVQTRACLPEQLQSFDQLGDGTNLDVIVLEWESKCNQTSEHIAYHFDNTSTWSSGRNRLYHLALLRRRRYLYYIFLDDDLEFTFTKDVLSRGALRRRLGESPLRLFERFLRFYEPAVGLTNFCSRCGKMLSNGSYVAHLCCSTRTAAGMLPALLPATISFDAAFNAFHASVAPHLLPYKLKYEGQSWWESQKYIILASDVLFRGQVMRYNGVTVVNKNHGDYPQQQLDNWKDILDQIRDQVPVEYREQRLFFQDPIVDMVPKVEGEVVYTERWNMSIPRPKTPIVPFRHFSINRYD